MASKLSPTQIQFVKELYGSSMGNLKEAAKKVIGSEDYEGLLTADLIAEIKKRGDEQLAMSVPKAIYVLTNMLENPGETLFLDKLSKIAQDLLDRAGLSKNERPQTSTLQIGIVLLPTKVALPEPPTIEGVAHTLAPMLMLPENIKL
jgi:hypothetical protein